MPDGNGEARPWSESDLSLFEDDEAVCSACDEPLRAGQVVQERPSFSLKFWHVTPGDCAQ